MTKLGEEMSLRFLRREAKLCGFLQKSFLALEKVGAVGSWAWPPALAGLEQTGVVPPQRMKTSESARLKAESGLREELESRWQKLQELDEERVQALWGQRKVGGRGLGVGWGVQGRRSQGRLHTVAGRMPPPGAVPGPGQGRGPADQVRAAESGVAEPSPAG